MQIFSLRTLIFRDFYLFLISFCSLALAEESELIIKDKNAFFTDFNVGFYEDKSAKLGFDDIKKNINFQQGSNRFSLGYSSSVFWFKLKLTNVSKEDGSFYIKLTENLFDKVNAYIEVDENQFQVERKGVGYFVSGKKNELVKPDFFVFIPKGRSRDVYISITSLYPSFGAIEVYNKERLMQKEYTYDILYAIYSGIIFSLALYNFFIFLFSREITYLYYVLYVSSFLLWQLQHNDIYPFDSENSTFSYYTHSILIPFSVAFLSLFSRVILLTKKYTPKIDKWLLKITYLFFFLGISSIFYLQASYIVLNIITSFVLPFFIYVGYKSYSLGNKIALFYIIALLIFLSLATFYSLLATGIMEYNLLNRHGIVFGSMIEIILFSLVLAYRIRVLQEEKIAIVSQANLNLDKRVQERTIELENSKEELKRISNLDSMTNLFNRRYLFEVSKKLIPFSKRQSLPLSILMFDIDNFKNINDNYGHAIGDTVIKNFANRLMQSRESDIAARIGGEEFVLLLPNTDAIEAQKIANDIREDVNEDIVLMKDNKTISYTISGGVASIFYETENSADQLLYRADKALYQAKKRGKNRIIVSEIENKKQ